MTPTGSGGPAVRTVLGDVPGAALGVCDAHDHLFLRSPRLPGQELADLEAAEAELRGFAALGGRSVVQWTPYGMGRRSGALVELARRTGVHLVAATGLHQAAHYAPGASGEPGDVSARDLPGYGSDDPSEGLAELADLFTEELTQGVRGGVCGERARAGLIKVAGGCHGLDPHARRTLGAAARAHHGTGAPVAVHLEGGTAAPDVLALLCGELGVPARSVLLGHLGRFPDTGLHREVAEAGAWLVFDGPSRAHHATDRRLFDCLAALVEDGHGARLLVGADTTTAAARGAPGMPYLLRTLRPRMEREFGPELAEQVFVRNPARAFAADWAGVPAAPAPPAA
ncbi:phosphotriesterase family protein [Streptomyces daliensis]|uniref:Phosphotriesterase n=1 Tax=Streptomyces daliensis TaxID=299421 RepID=A0A8T4IYR1_9ACTN|nr:phosphotriesterase [Streptomyces daliensis]